MLIPANPTLSDFAKVFLARFVKPSDSVAACIGTTILKHTGSVEVFAAHFRNVNGRITVGIPIDTTTLATHFINGLKGKVVKAFATVTNLETMQKRWKLSSTLLTSRHTPLWLLSIQHHMVVKGLLDSTATISTATTHTALVAQAAVAT